MARAIDIRLSQLPALRGLRWCLAGCSTLAALMLYLDGAMWPAGAALALALFGLLGSAVQAVQSLHVWPDRAAAAGRGGDCEAGTAGGRVTARITSVSTWGDLRLLRFHRGVPARTLLLWPGTVAPAQERQFGRWLKAICRG